MSKPIFQLIAHDHKRDHESWNWMAVIHFVGPLAMSSDLPSCVSDEQIHEIYGFLETYGIHIRSAGSGVAGHPFANEPFIQWFPHHIIITQSGGLDV